ncbi:MAG: Na+/H+ antiporter NhaC family protein [Bacillota bacterium]|nr:Na+/H+ antiporter NhaC family protein [Bacillota bacterium]MDW7676365.1 Na+/H+ antiporter NhaC family protein [Bacillota bacterium]
MATSDNNGLFNKLEKNAEFKKTLIVYGILALFFSVVVFLIPADLEDFGILTLIPAAFLLIYIFYTKRIFESLILGALLGFLMKFQGGFFTPVSESFLNILMNEDIAWLFIVCGLMGSIIALIERGGGALAFGNWVAKRAKTRKSTLLWTWLLGVVIFLDDYLNCLTVGSSMTPITDKHKVSREYLAYIVDSTAAPVCVLIPISTWAIFIGSLMEQYGMAPSGQGIAYFIRTIPFNFYGWFAALIVPLVIVGVIPIIGPMKKAETRALETGVLAPPGSEKIDMKAGEQFEVNGNANVWHFFLPILFLIGSTIYFELDMQMGVIATCGFIFIYYIIGGVMSPEEYMDMALLGLKNMLPPLMLVVLAYFFADASEQIGFIDYVIDIGRQFMTPQLFPLVIFITFGITEFIMGISWGMYVIALPIVIPLAAALGADPFVAVGAVCSAGVWGSHICFYSDATILTSAATGCDNFRHAITQLPYGMIAAFFTAIAFLITGFVMA